ncbi:CinA family nicotinamide mononucleotide deamidase-related protein [Thermodesulfatator atlanticus]
MKGAILAVGNELVEGRVLNRTSFLAARTLLLNGYETAEIVTIPDDHELIERYLNDFLKRYQFLIISGGLGPTTDDITNEAVAKALGRPLVRHEDMVARIKARERAQGLSHNPLRLKMAELPQGAELLTYDHAIAGYYLRANDKLIFCLPGVPEEFELLLESRVIPLLKKLLPTDKYFLSRVFKVFGLREADINLALECLLHKENIKIGFYPALPEIHISLLVWDSSFDTAQALFMEVSAKIEKTLGPNIFGHDEDVLESVVGKLLNAKGETLAVAESCTGGLIASRLTRIPGSSAYFERGVVTYSNQAKIEILGVPEEAINRHGAVSKPVALAMAEGVRKLSGTTYGIGVTGIAGPTGGSAQKPVGTVWIGFSCPEDTVAQCFLFPGERHLVQDYAASTALDWLRRYLTYGTLVPSYQFPCKS